MDLPRGSTVDVLRDVQLQELEAADLNPWQTCIQEGNEKGADNQEEEEEDEDAHACAYAASETMWIVSGGAASASFVIGIVFRRQLREGDMARTFRFEMPA